MAGGVHGLSQLSNQPLPLSSALVPEGPPLGQFSGVGSELRQQLLLRPFYLRRHVSSLPSVPRFFGLPVPLSPLRRIGK
jgi:hypothetical protein